QCDRLLRGAARQRPAGAMRAGTKALRIALAAHDEAFSAHRARNNAELALTGAHRALARDQHLLAEMGFARDIIVMAVDRAFTAIWSRPHRTAERRRHRAE